MTEDEKVIEIGKILVIRDGALQILGKESHFKGLAGSLPNRFGKNGA
jgi:hypothetical protein